MSKCLYCDNGELPKRSDADGVLGHADVLRWWPCLNQIESEEDYHTAMAACESLVDLDPAPETLDGRRLAAWVVVIEDYEYSRQAEAAHAQAMREAAANELLSKAGY